MLKSKSPHFSSINSCSSPCSRIQRIRSSTFTEDKELRGQILESLFSKGDWKLVNLYVQSVVTANENLLTAKENLLAEKDKRISEKDDVIKAKDELLKEKDKRIDEAIQLYLRSKGLMSCRGIFEFYVYRCFGELQKLDLAKSTMTFNVKSVIELLERNKGKLPKEAIFCMRLLNQAEKCGVKNLYDLYAKLSTSIHGDPWDGPSVRVYKSLLDSSDICMIDFIAEDSGLKTEDVSPTL